MSEAFFPQTDSFLGAHLILTRKPAKLSEWNT